MPLMTERKDSCRIPGPNARANEPTKEELSLNDPTITDPDTYTVIFENERVRVLEYRDEPGHRTSPHGHPDSVMYTLSSFKRRLASDGREMDAEIHAGSARWLDAQEHSGHNIGDTETHVIFVELKEPNPAGEPAGGPRLGPSSE